MPDAVNPYHSPEMAAVPEKSLAAHCVLTDAMLSYLKEASPWLKFVGVLGFISSGLPVIWGLSMFAFFPLIKESLNSVPGLEVFGETSGMIFGMSMAVFFIGIGVVMIFPSLFIYKKKKKIRDYLQTGSDLELELAFKINKSFWKFVGIFSIVGLASFPLPMIGIIIAALVTTLA
jgi:hypothetical protein